MTPRARLDTEGVVAAAARLADNEGLEAVSLTRLATELGIRAPSLYAHLNGVTDLRARLAARGARELAAELQAAATGRAGTEALKAMADAYRAYALNHRGLYMAIQGADNNDGDASTAARATLLDVVLAVLRAYGLTGDAAIHAARAVRSALHGFVALETSEGFGYPLALEESYRRLLAILDRGLASAAAAESG
jgi:AcrR family transcriptional regulator